MKPVDRFIKSALQDDIIIGTPIVQKSSISNSANSLFSLLSDHFKFYVKAYTFHWNTTGPRFSILHAFFQQIWAAEPANIDLIAERIRQLGCLVNGSLKAFCGCGDIQEASGTELSENEMLSELLDDVNTIIQNTRELVNTMNNGQDFATCDMLIKMLDEYEKTAWLIRSHLSE